MDKVYDKKFEDLKKQSFGFEPASERRTEPVVKYLAKEKAKQQEETKIEEPVEVSPPTFIGLEDPEKS